MSEYVSFEEAEGLLDIDEESLKHMVAEGEVRAFRTEGRTAFKREDIERLKEAMAAEPIIVPPGEGSEAVSEAVGEDELETVLNIEGLGEIDLGEEIEAITRPDAEVESPLGKAEEDEDTFIVVEEPEPGGAPSDTIAPEPPARDTITMEDETAVEEETFVLSEADIGDETESLELLGETSTVMEEAEKAAPEPGEAASAEFVRSAAHPGVEAGLADRVYVGLLVVTIIVMAVGLFACLGLIFEMGNPLLNLLSGG